MPERETHRSRAKLSSRVRPIDESRVEEPRDPCLVGGGPLTEAVGVLDGRQLPEVRRRAACPRIDSGELLLGPGAGRDEKRGAGRDAGNELLQRRRRRAGAEHAHGREHEPEVRHGLDLLRSGEQLRLGE